MAEVWEDLREIVFDLRGETEKTESDFWTINEAKMKFSFESGLKLWGVLNAARCTEWEL